MTGAPSEAGVTGGRLCGVAPLVRRSVLPRAALKSVPAPILFSRCLLLLLLAGWLSSARAADPVVDASSLSDGPLVLTPFLAVLEDPGGELTLDEVRAPALAGRFQDGQADTAALALGFTRSAYWLRLTLRNPGDTALPRLLVLDNPTTSRVHAFFPEGGAYRSVLTGSDTAFATRPYANRNFVFPLTLPPGAEQTVYLRVQSSIGLLVPVQLWRPEAFQAHERADYGAQAWYFGIATAMFLFNLMLFVALRDRVYVLYLAFLLCTVGALSAKNGLAAQFLGVGDPLPSNVAYWGGVSLAITCLLLFMRRLLETPRLLPRTDRVLLGLALLYLLTLPVYALALQSVARAAILLNLLTVLLVLGTAIAAAWRRQRSAYFFLLAFALLMLGGATTTLRALGIVPTNAFTVDGIQLGSAMEMLALAFALADRYNQLRREKSRAQKALLATQQELVETLRNSERELEQRVAQRTGELQALNSRLAALSLTDDLTGIANRRRFEEVLAQEWRRAARQGQPLALAMVDVDWFKDYNDHYGHQAGDTSLRQIAQALSAAVSRSGDLVARYGGEEFVFLVPATDGASALGMARKVVQAVADLALPHASSPLGRISVSVGVACCVPGVDDTPEVLLQRADTALYQAKARGRDGVVLAAD